MFLWKHANPEKIEQKSSTSIYCSTHFKLLLLTLIHKFYRLIALHGLQINDKRHNDNYVWLWQNWQQSLLIYSKEMIWQQLDWVSNPLFMTGLHWCLVRQTLLFVWSFAIVPWSFAIYCCDHLVYICLFPVFFLLCLFKGGFKITFPLTSFCSFIRPSYSYPFFSPFSLS